MSEKDIKDEELFMLSVYSEDTPEISPTDDVVCPHCKTHLSVRCTYEVGVEHVIVIGCISDYQDVRCPACAQKFDLSVTPLYTTDSSQYDKCPCSFGRAYGGFMAKKLPEGAEKIDWAAAVKGVDA